MGATGPSTVSFLLTELSTIEEELSLAFEHPCVELFWKTIDKESWRPFSSSKIIEEESSREAKDLGEKLFLKTIDDPCEDSDSNFIATEASFDSKSLELSKHEMLQSLQISKLKKENN